MSRFDTGLFCIAFILLVVNFFGAPAVTANSLPVSILYQGSVQGNMSRSTGGIMASAKTVMDEVRSANPGLIQVSCGNMLGPSIHSAESRGLEMVGLMNECGFEAMALGPHDFFSGFDDLIRCASEAAFPFLAANLIVASESSLGASTLIRPWIKLDRNGRSIMLIGLIDPDLIKDWPGWNPKIKTRSTLEVMKEIEGEAVKADYTIVLGSLRFAEGQKILKHFKWVDAVISNQLGSEEVLDDVSLEYRLIDGRRMCWSFHPGSVMGLLKLEHENARCIGSLEPVIVRKDHHGDAKFESKIATIEQRTQDSFGKTVAELSPSELANPAVTLLNILRYEMNAEVAVIHGGSLHNARAADKDVSAWTIRQWFPFPDRTAILTVGGAKLKELWMRRNDKLVGNEGLLFAGIEEKKGKIIVNGRELNPNDRYRVATVEYLARGGLGLFPNTPAAVKNIGFTALLTAHFSKKPSPAQRKVLDAHAKKPIIRRRTALNASFNKFEFGGSAAQYQYIDPSAMYRGSDLPGLVGMKKRQELLALEHETILDRPNSDTIMRLRLSYMTFNKFKMIDSAAGTVRYEKKSLFDKIHAFGQLDLSGTILQPALEGKQHPLFGKAVTGLLTHPIEGLKILGGIGEVVRLSWPDKPKNTGVNFGYEFTRKLRRSIDLVSNLDFFASVDADHVRTFNGDITLKFEIVPGLSTIVRESDFGWKDDSISKIATRREYFLGFSYEKLLREF